MERMEKRILWILWVLVLLLMLFFFGRYFTRKKLVRDYNLGCTNYTLGWYDHAELYFKEAFKETHSEKEDCMIRINLALSMVRPLTPDSITEDNFDETIAKLEEAREVLLEKGCAHDADEDGHNEQAQILKDEIDEYIEQLKQAQSAKPQEGSEAEEQPDEEDEEDEQQKQLRQELEEVERQGMKERQQDISTGKSLGSFDFYDGMCW